MKIKEPLIVISFVSMGIVFWCALLLGIVALIAPVRRLLLRVVQ